MVLEGDVSVGHPVTILSMKAFMSWLLRARTAEGREGSLKVAVALEGKQSLITRIMQGREDVEQATAGQEVAAVLRGTGRDEVARDDLILGEGFAAYFASCPCLPTVPETPR